MAKLHGVAGALALALVVTFWIATAVSETLLGPGAVVWVKTTIPFGFGLLIPVIAIAGITGTRLGGDARHKLRRMPLIALNGVLILVPAALFLAQKAQDGAFDAVFYTVQVVELAAGAVNATLLAFNLRDGLRLAAARGQTRQARARP